MKGVVSPQPETSGSRGQVKTDTTEIDLSLIRWTLSMSPVERLRYAVRSGKTIARLRRAR